METRLHLEILPQPNQTTCGPTCLQALYAYYGDKVPLEQVIREVPELDWGGTLAVFLGCHALRRGYSATIYTYNLQVFDPSWFTMPGTNIVEKLKQQRQHKTSKRLQMATRGYLDFYSLGGKVKFEDLNPELIKKYLNHSTPILTGLSATYLYRCARENEDTLEYNDIAGVPAGHFVVLCGYDRPSKEVLVADPLFPNPFTDKHLYTVRIDRVIAAILLGILTYDANLLIIEPARK